EQFRFAPRTGAAFGGRLLARRSMRAICNPGRSTMKQQAVEERRDWGADIMEVGGYLVLILLVTLLWGYISASAPRVRRQLARAPTGGRKRHARQGAARVRHAARERGRRVATRRARAAAAGNAGGRVP